MAAALRGVAFLAAVGAVAVVVVVVFFFGGMMVELSLLSGVSSSSSSASSTSPRDIPFPNGKRGMLANDKIMLIPHTLFLPSLLRRRAPLSLTSPNSYSLTLLR